MSFFVSGILLKVNGTLFLSINTYDMGKELLQELFRDNDRLQEQMTTLTLKLLENETMIEVPSYDDKSKEGSCTKRASFTIGSHRGSDVDNVVMEAVVCHVSSVINRGSKKVPPLLSHAIP